MKKRRILLETLLHWNFGSEVFNMPISDFLRCINDALEAVPDEYKNVVTIENDYSCECGGIMICYQRPETDEELAERLARERERHDQTRAEELAMLARLKQKYEDER